MKSSEVNSEESTQVEGSEEKWRDRRKSYDLWTSESRIWRRDVSGGTTKVYVFMGRVNPQQNQTQACLGLRLRLQVHVRQILPPLGSFGIIFLPLHSVLSVGYLSQ